VINSLVAYKGKPARISNTDANKFALEFADGQLALLERTNTWSFCQ
jgi:hypothetical protein